MSTPLLDLSCLCALTHSMTCYVHNKSGSHKAGIDLPDGWRDLSKGVHDMVHRVPAAAGDCIIVTTQLCSFAHAPFPIDNNRAFLRLCRRVDAACRLHMRTANPQMAGMLVVY